MDIYGLIFIYELLNYYAKMLNITFESFSIEMHTDKGTKYNVINWDDVDKFIQDLLDGYNLQYQKLVRNAIKEKKGIVPSEADPLIKKCIPFTKEEGFFNLWLGEKYTAAERATVQPIPWVTINHIIRITGCLATMTSSVDSYTYSVNAYTNKLYDSNEQDSATKTTYTYILSRLVNEKVTTLTYNQLAKNECPQELNSILKKCNKMLDKLRSVTDHESISNLTVTDFMLELSKYVRADSPYLKVWRQVYEPFNISEKDSFERIDPSIDAEKIIKAIF